MPRYCAKVGDAYVEVKIVKEQCDMNVKDGVNLISSSNSGPLEPFIGIIFDDIQDDKLFYKAYEKQRSFSIRINTRFSKEEKKLIN